MIDKQTIDKILQTADIVDVVSDFVTLKRAGANLKGLCPFHDDRTPSFIVSPAKNICHCFACGEGGSPLNFIMKHESLTFPDALRYLARKYNITIEEKELTDEQKQAQTDRDSMFIVNEWANKWFQEQLYQTDDGRAIGLAYFRARGFRDDILKKFQVGYCPDRKDRSLGNDALKAGYKERYLVNIPDEHDPKQSIGTGLCMKNDHTGGLRDRFRGRVMWPIYSQSGRVAGFGGRVLDMATKGVNVKYMNSPESIIYSKRNELFGLFQARQAISKKDLCFLVEGYTDVMAMHQNGIENVVASSGTALTQGQIAIIHRLTSNITVIYDGDPAGIKASERGIDLLLAAGMNVKLLLLPDGDDPDSFGRKHTAQEYQQYIASHQVDFIHYKTGLLMEEAKGDPQALSNFINNIVRSIAIIPDEITRVLYVRQASQTVQMSEKIISDAVSRQMKANREEWAKEQERRRRNEARDPQADTPQAGEPLPPMEEELMSTDKKKEELLTQMVVRKGEKVIIEVEEEDGNKRPLTLAEYIFYNLQGDGLYVHTPVYKRILDEAVAHAHEEGFEANRHFINHPDPEVSQTAFLLSTDQETLSKVHQNGNQPEEEDDTAQLADTVDHLLCDIKLGVVREQLKHIIEQVKNPAVKADKERFASLLNEFKEKKEVERILAKQCGDRVMG